eukprot:gene11574-24210_t
MFDSETQVRPTGLILGTLHSIKRPNLITLLTWSSIIILCVLSPFIFQENSIIPLKQSLRDVLIANISLNIPPALDLVFEYIYLQKEVEFELSPTCVIVLASILPNILIIFYVLPNNSTKLMMGLFSIQLITCSQLILTYMLKNLVFMQKAALLRLLKWVWIISIILSNFADNSTDIAIISRNALISQRAFMRHVSHEIRTPLNTICLGIELVRKSICNGSDAVELLEDLADIETSANVAVETLSEMLLFDKLREGNVPIEKTKFLIAEFLTSTIQPFYIQARSSQLKLDLIVQDSDRKLHINDIIDDAAAAIKELVIDVTDNGPGITPYLL